MSIFAKVAERARSASELANFFYIQRIDGFNPPDQPDLDAATHDRLKNELARCRSYLEFGSGGSTLIADRLGVRTTSIESDPFYARAVRKALSPRNSVTLLTPDLGITKRSGWPAFGSARKGMLYVNAPFPMDPFPDLVLVDGRYRAACALESARQAHIAGATSALIFDDYLYRPQYHGVEQFLGEPERVGRSAVFKIGDRPVAKTAVEMYAADAW